MSESAALPAFVFAMFAIGIAVERPTLWAQASVVVALTVAYGVRAQGLVLVAILPAALLLALVLDLRAGVARTDAVRRLRRYWPLAAALGVAALAFLANSGFSPGRSIGFYRVVATTHYAPQTVALWTARHAGEAVLAVGIAPACAFLLLLATALTRGLPERAERAFVATATASVFLFLVQTGAYQSAFNRGIQERYSFYAFPPLLICFVLWLARGLPRPRFETLSAAVAAVALASFILFSALLRPSTVHEAVFASLTLHFFRRVPEHVPGGLLSARILLFALAASVALLFAWAPARFLRPALPAGVAVLLLLASHSAYGSLAPNTRAWPNWTGTEPQLDRRKDWYVGRKGCLSVRSQPVDSRKFDHSREHAVLEQIAWRHLLVRLRGIVPAQNQPVADRPPDGRPGRCPRPEVCENATSRH